MLFVLWHFSLPVSVILSPRHSLTHLFIPPSHSGMDSGEPISSWSCLLFAPVNSASLEWPSLFIEGLFIWTTWLLCPNPEITFGSLWKGWWVSVIWCFSCWTDITDQWQLFPFLFLAQEKSFGPKDYENAIVTLLSKSVSYLYVIADASVREMSLKIYKSKV